MSRYRPDVKIIARTGCPGTGKTTRLSKECWTWPTPWQIVTYSNTAAGALHQKGIPADLAETIYKRTWPHVREVSKMRHTGAAGAALYQSRAIEDADDYALLEYVQGAPSRRKRDEELEQLHAWTPAQGPAPSWIWDKSQVNNDRKYAVGLARWLDRGAPLAHAPYQFVAYDEAQDASRLTLSAALATVAEGGTLLACGDEGQAIFNQANGYRSDELPAAWQWADEIEYMSPGYRVGRPATEIASTVLAPYAWHDPELYSAGHPTLVHWWDGFPPASGLVMGLSRYSVDRYIKAHGLRNVELVPGIHEVEGLAVTTIHAAKGHEADHVYLLPWSKNKLTALDNGSADLLRLAYVALTRARYHVHLTTDHFARWT